MGTGGRVLVMVALLSCQMPFDPQGNLPGYVAALPIQFAALGLGETVTVNVRSEGCFHHYEATLQVEARAAGTYVSGKLNLPYPLPEGRRQIVIPERNLSSQEVSALDRMLAIYREPGRPDGCTTRTTLALALVSPSREAADERYVDESCMDRPGDALFFDTLVWEALQAAVAEPTEAAPPN